MSELRQLLESGKITREDYCFYEGADGWKLLGELSLAGDRPAPLPALPPPFSVPPPFRDISSSGWHHHDYDWGFTVRSKNNGMSYASFVLGCLSFVFAVFTAIPGVICGHMALRQHETDPSLLGKAWAVAGLWISWIVIILNVLAVIAVALFWAVVFSH